jgi:SAM-dependent methyltransferase
VQERYGAAAREREACLCSPVSFDPGLLDVIPIEVVERDYGCGNPTRWVRHGDVVLDLGSGSGNNAFICAHVVGEEGRVSGLDRNDERLALAR